MRCISSGLYNFLSQNNTKRFKILIAIFIFGIVALMLLFANDIFSDQSLYYYTFSTIVQGFLALVALLGAVVVYKLQIIETELNSTRDRMESDLTYFLAQAPYSFSWIEAMNEAKKILDNNTKDSVHKSYIERIEMNWKKLDKLSKERGVIRSKMVDFSLLSFINIGLALIALPLSKMILINKFFFLGSALLILNITISYISMIFAFKIIRLVLGYSFSIRL